MAKRKITVTVDEELIDSVRGDERSLSAVVNAALGAEVARRERRAALTAMLDELDTRFGPVPDDVLAEAHAAFDELDTVVVSA